MSIVQRASLASTRVSVLIQYLRLVVQRPHRIMCWALIAYNTVYMLISLFLLSLLCRPVPFFWDRTIPGGVCGNISALWWANSAFDIFSDLLLCFFPYLFLRALHLSKQQRRALIFVLALAGRSVQSQALPSLLPPLTSTQSTSIMTLLRFRSIVLMGTTHDLARYLPEVSAWSIAEMNVGVTCACLPTLRPLYKLVVRKPFGSIASGPQPKSRNIKPAGINDSQATNKSKLCGKIQTTTTTSITVSELRDDDLHTVEKTV